MTTMDTMTEKTPTETGGLSEDRNEVHRDMMGYVTEFLDATGDARANSERCRDYFDGKQWTAEQIAELKRRKQAPIVNNRIKVKLNGLLGLVSLRKTDPKAYPRNEDADSGAAEAVTDGLRYVADATKFQSIRRDVASNFFCEGYGGALIGAERTKRGDIEVTVEHIKWDRIIYDPYSQNLDFSDARYKGFGVWMDEEDIRSTFEEVDEDVFALKEMDTDETFEDKPRWYNRLGKRHRFFVVTLYYIEQGVWKLCIFTAGGFLLKPNDSPWLDEYGDPVCGLELVGAYIDRENNRYGEIASFLDLQDEVNHRRSKMLFLLSQRQTFSNRGAVKDIKKAKRELAKPDGHLQIDTGELNKDFGILPTGDMAQGQLELLQEAKQEIDAQGYNAQMAGERQQGNLSGVAIGKLENSGVTELNNLFDQLKDWELRVYRQIWYRIRQFWDEEKWVRVTDDYDQLKYVGFNVATTVKEALQEVMDDESKSRAERMGAAAQMIIFEQGNPQALEQIIEIRNRPAELDMDIILDQSYDTINSSQEQLDAIIQFGAQNQFDLVDLLEISSIRHKERLIEKIENRRKEAAEQMANQPPDPQSQYLTAKASEAAANVEVKKQDAMQTAIENQLLQQHGPVGFKGSVSA